MDVIGNGVSAAIGGLAVAFVDSLLFRRYGRLADKVESLEKERLARLETLFEKHVEADVSQRLLTEVRTLVGAVNKLGDAVTRYGERTASQEAHLGAHDASVNNLEKMLRSHLENHRPNRK